MNNFEKSVDDLSTIFMKYLKYKKVKGVNFEVPELSFFLQSDQEFIEICENVHGCDFKADITCVKNNLSLLSNYLGKEKLHPLERRLETVSACEEFSDIINDIFLLIIENYEKISKSLSTTWEYFEELMKKVNLTHSRVVESIGGKLEITKSDTEHDKNLLTMMQDVNGNIKEQNDIELLKSNMMSQMDDLIHLVEQKLVEKEERVKEFSDEYDNIKDDIDGYKVQTEKLRNNVEKYRLESITDYLTGLYNRKYMSVRLEEEQERANRLKSTFAIVMMDIDDFKKINDTHGHIVGDYVLKYMAKVISSVLRKIDVAFRYGGEEFLILLPETDLEKAKLAAERVRSAIVNTVFKYKDNKIRITVSQGVSEYSGEENYMDTIERTDSFLLKAKRSGKDKVISG